MKLCSTSCSIGHEICMPEKKEKTKCRVLYHQVMYTQPIWQLSIWEGFQNSHVICGMRCCWFTDEIYKQSRSSMVKVSKLLHKYKIEILYIYIYIYIYIISWNQIKMYILYRLYTSVGQLLLLFHNWLRSFLIIYYLYF